MVFQEPTTKKLKVHDTYDEMACFSEVWKKFPVLYDEAQQNSCFSKDFKGTGAYIRQCYEDMGRELSLSTEEVQKRHIKYVDVVTKGLLQLKTDIEKGTSVCPIPAIHKLRIFRWLWPYSKNFDANLMQDVNFEAYMERAVVAQVNKLTHAKQDTSLARETLHKVREFNEKRDLEKCGLKTATEFDVNVVTFDDMSVVTDLEDVCASVSLWSICDYLPPSRDPTFQYTVHGFVFFGTSVTMSTSETFVKSVCKRSDPVLCSLKSSGTASFKTKQAVCCAQSAEAAYIDALASVVGRRQVASEGDNAEHDLIQCNAEVLRRLSEFNTSVCDAVQVAQVYVDE